MVNANINYAPCSELADAVVSAVEYAIGGFESFLDENNLWLSVHDTCINAAIRDMVDPEIE